MKRSILLVVTCGIIAWADITVKVPLLVPPILFPVVPTIVVVSPGISVVENFDHEVFVVKGSYWTWHNGSWFSMKGNKGKWVVSPVGRVPPGLVKMPHGKYVKYKAVKHGPPHGKGRGKGKNK